MKSKDELVLDGKRMTPAQRKEAMRQLLAYEIGATALAYQIDAAKSSAIEGSAVPDLASDSRAFWAGYTKAMIDMEKAIFPPQLSVTESNSDQDGSNRK